LPIHFTWIDTRDGWPPFVTSLAKSWLTNELRDRCITRDLSWGIPVPRPGFENKVFYVWFDAPIAYIAATQTWSLGDPARRDWRADDVCNRADGFVDQRSLWTWMTSRPSRWTPDGQSHW